MCQTFEARSDVSVRNISKLLKDSELRRLALALVDTGLTSEQAGTAVGVKKMTVAGWRAARTKGQYDD